MNEFAATYDGSSGHAAGGTALAHVIPPGVLLAVFAALMAMTAITVAVTWVDLGPWNLAAAMAIATAKASLVALYFMHLRYDQPFNALVFVSALAFLALFLVLTLMDTVDAEPDVQQFRQASPPAVSRGAS
jgi:cytochrome c oxidase subunit 4